MKLRRVSVENVRSFLERQELRLTGDIAIIIGPNGGGKTNLLDTAVLALRIFLLKSWMPRHSPTPEWQDRYDWTGNDILNANLLERHSAGTNLPQVIELDIEVTNPDIENIQRAKAEALQLYESTKSRYTSFPGEGAANWNTEVLTPGLILSYKVENGSVNSIDSPAAATFFNYLQTYEVHSRVWQEYRQRPLSMPMISLPVNRSAADVPARVSLADYNEFESKRSVDASSSRLTGSITTLAMGRLASRYRELLELDNGQAKLEFVNDAAIKSFGEILATLGYGWDIECTNIYRNEYSIRLSKQGSSFRISAASSGERELLIYLFAIYALNVRDALIVVDEPELHLHPRWQKTLLGLFERLAEETGNQFLMATHSPVFVSPSSIQYVSRVYTENQRSRLIKLGDNDLPEPKHLFSIVNSQNNERVFFADLVVLVEGISDRIFFEALFRNFKLGEGTGKVYEVISVGGKMLFSQYEKLLIACRVPYLIIADLDYVQQIGNEAVKILFTVSHQNLKQKVIDDISSVDGQSLVKRMDESLMTADLDELKQLWEYIKSRHVRLRANLTPEDKAILNEFIREQHMKSRYILSRGALEDYLPSGYKNKDLEKLIRFVSEPNFWERLPEEGKSELETIINSIISRISTDYTNVGGAACFDTL